MISLLFTLDYELYGDGSGDIDRHIIAPTKRWLAISNRQGAKVTIFAEVAEILAMKSGKLHTEKVQRIEEQLQGALNEGHDIQLHIHPQWFGAQKTSRGWDLNYTQASIAKLPYRQSLSYLRECRDYLETLLGEVDPEYRCTAFRAGYWCMQPSENILKALQAAGLQSDTSVFKWGLNNGAYVSYDYQKAHSSFEPWYVDGNDINKVSKNAAGILEVPIYTERVRLPAMLSAKRILLKKKMMQESRTTKLKTTHQNRLRKIYDLIVNYHPKKFDFCKLNFYEMRRMLENVIRIDAEAKTIPVCAIGHSKDFLIQKDYARLLNYVNEHHAGTVKVENYRSFLTRYIDNQRKSQAQSGEDHPREDPEKI